MICGFRKFTGITADDEDEASGALQVTRHMLQATYYNLQLTTYKLQVTSYEASGAGCTLMREHNCAFR